MALSADLCVLGASQGPTLRKCSGNPGRANDYDGLKGLWDTPPEVHQGSLEGILVTFLEFVLPALERKEGKFEQRDDSAGGAPTATTRKWERSA